MTTLQAMKSRAWPVRWLLSALTVVALGAVSPLTAMAADVRSGDTITVRGRGCCRRSLRLWQQRGYPGHRAWRRDRGGVHGDGHGARDGQRHRRRATSSRSTDQSMARPIAGNALTVAASVANDVLLAGATPGSQRLRRSVATFWLAAAPSTCKRLWRATSRRGAAR